MNLFKSLDSGLGKIYAQGCPPLGRHGFIKSTPLEGLAAPSPWWWCLLGLCAFCVVSDLWLTSWTHHTYVLEVLQSIPPRLAPYFGASHLGKPLEKKNIPNIITCTTGGTCMVEWKKDMHFTEVAAIVKVHDLIINNDAIRCHPSGFQDIIRSLQARSRIPPITLVNTFKSP